MILRFAVALCLAVSTAYGQPKVDPVDTVLIYAVIDSLLDEINSVKDLADRLEDVRSEGITPEVVKDVDIHMGRLIQLESSLSGTNRFYLKDSVTEINVEVFERTRRDVVDACQLSRAYLDSIRSLRARQRQGAWVYVEPLRRSLDRASVSAIAIFDAADNATTNHRLETERLRNEVAFRRIDSLLNTHGNEINLLKQDLDQFKNTQKRTNNAFKWTLAALIIVEVVTLGIVIGK